MENKFMTALKNENNLTYTENHARTYKSTMNGLLDLFALGGAYRTRSDEDCITLFKKAFEEDEIHALKCLYYLRDVRGGQGERRFFRVVMRWLANNAPEAARRNLQYIPEFGRYDDLYLFVGTPLENDALSFIRHQLALDVECKTPSLLAKWLPSENTSSAKTRALATKTRQFIKMTSKQYRKTLSILRKRINVLERLMSEGKWDEIEFDKIPSKAGLIYRNAFARHDIERKKNKAVQSYEDFAKDKNTTVNAGTLYPCEVVHKATKLTYARLDDTQRLMVNKYWDNLTDVFKNATFNGVAVVDTSGSMTWGTSDIRPIDVAIALGLYCAEKCSEDSPWHDCYISFASRPQFIETSGVDFVDKVRRIYEKNLCDNTNIEAVFDLILRNAINYRVAQKDMPENIVIISDMEFDAARDWRSSPIETVMETCMRKYAAVGYKLPKLVFWNVNARNDNIPMHDNGYVTFVSGYSPVLFEQVLTGKTSLDFVLDKLDSERYQRVR